MKTPKVRCINLDWLEVYATESQSNFPMDADYFRNRGYFVKERDYGTRVYAEMFTIEDEKGQPFMEVRRNPKSGASDFTGLSEYSCHLRLTNRACYSENPVELMRAFMLRHGYEFVRIFRIDVCLDFEYFDSGDAPEKFAKRYIERKYRKVNQAKLSLWGNDNWTDFDWESLSWGNPKSMVSTKLYNKSKELSRPKADKPYIRYSWFIHGLIDSPVDNTKARPDGSRYTPEIWRVEFSMKSQARNWIVIEDVSGKRQKTKAIPHTLELFDSKDKLMARFRDLSFHYFHFKRMEWDMPLSQLCKDATTFVDSKKARNPKRKDRCPDKQLFDFGSPATFFKLDQLPKASKPNNEEEILRRRLVHYKTYHLHPEIQKACDVLLQNLTRDDIRRYTEANNAEEVRILQQALSLKLNYPERDIVEILHTVRKLLSDNSIF